MEKYYKILGLTSTATKTEVKKAYRKLAFIYHPDRNQDPKAQEIFVLINIAYESIVQNPSKQRHKSTKSDVTKNTNEERIRVAKIRQEFQEARKKKQEELFFAKLTAGLYWKALIVFIFLGITASLIITADLFLPSHEVKDNVKQMRNTNYNGLVYNNTADLFLFDDTRIYYNRVWFGKFETNPQIILKKSWLTYTITEIGEPKSSIYRNKQGKIVQSTLWSKTDFNILLLPYVSIIVCLFPILTYFGKSKNVKFTFMFILTFVISAPFLVYFWIGNNRIFHILSLGFL